MGRKELKAVGGKHEASVAGVGGREEAVAGDAEPSRLAKAGQAIAGSFAAGVDAREGALVTGITVLGIFIGRAEILGLLAPFSLAYMLATYCWYRRAALFALLGAVVGRGWLLGYSAGVEEALMLAAFWLSAELIAGNGSRGDAEGDMPRGLVGTAVGACALARGVGRLWTGAAVYDLVLIIFELIMVATSAAVFHQGLPSLLGWRDRDEGLAPVISAGIMGGVALLGTAGLGIGELRIIWVLTTLIVLSFAGGGVLAGGGAGAVVGLILGLAVHLDLSLVVVLLLGGAAAGLALPVGRPGAVAGFTGAVLLSSWLLSTGSVFTPWELIAAVGMFLLNPLSLQRPAVREVAAAGDPARRSVRGAAGDIACLWNRKGDRRRGWRGLLGRPDRAAPPRRRRGSQDPDTPARLRSFARVFRRLADSFSEVTDAEEGVVSDQERAAGVIDIVGARVCRSCDRFSACWQKRFMNTYHMFSEMLATFEIEDGRSVDRRVQKLQRHCKMRSEEVLETMEAAWRVQQIGVKWSSQFAETRDLAASQFRGIAEMMEDFAVSMDRGERPRGMGARGETRLRYEAGVAATSRSGTSSGDSNVVRRLSAGELVVMLSDGMGSGERARQESRAAVSLLEDLLELGLDRESALRTVNSVLVLRSTEEVFATVDLMSVDMTTGQAEFTKIGAAPTFVMRGRDVLCIPAQVVPIGILEDVSLESTRRMLQPGDMVVMMTDGVMEALGDLTASQKRSWMSRFLASTRHECPEDLASAVVARAVSLCHDGLSDDMSVIAVKLDEG